MTISTTDPLILIAALLRRSISGTGGTSEKFTADQLATAAARCLRVHAMQDGSVIVELTPRGAGR